MQSVKELILESNREERERREAYEAEQEKERKKQESKQFSAEVAYLIKQFNFLKPFLFGQMKEGLLKINHINLSRLNLNKKKLYSYRMMN